MENNPEGDEEATKVYNQEHNCHSVLASLAASVALAALYLPFVIHLLTYNHWTIDDDQLAMTK